MGRITKIFEKLEDPKNQKVIFWSKNNVPLVVQILEQLHMVTKFSHTS